MGDTNFTPAHLIPAKKINSSHRPHEVEPNTSYRMWGLVSRQNDSLVQRDSTSSYVNCKGTFSDKTGNSKCSLCCPFLALCPFFLFFVYHASLSIVTQKSFKSVTGASGYLTPRTPDLDVRGSKPRPLLCFLRQGTLLHFVSLHPGE